jgi:hypothetical protein
LVIARYAAQARRSLREPVVPYTTYYLFYLDANGDEMIDDAFGSLQEALEQAEHGFGIKPDEWTMVAE